MDNMTLLIDPDTRDLVFDETGCFKKIYDTDTVIQNVRHVLITWKGEFFSDESYGTDYDSIVGKNQNDINDGDVEEAIREAVFQETDVSRIEDITLSYENRHLTVNVKAILEDEEIITVGVTA